jgi:2-polyprenyl-6-hydroxyphenyl methylase/3-demethylubiquinone-9 3-methyltransferase
MSFIAMNKRAAWALERRRGRRWDEDVAFREAAVLPALRGRVADIGGGKKPFLESVGGLVYVGLDIDLEELRRAPPVYTATRVCDIQSPPDDLLGGFDVIICRYTLEHVEDAEKAIAGLVAMLAPGGVCFGVVPCERAIFSRINRRIPEALKRRLLFALFPGKTGDGFPAYYDRGTPSQYLRMIRAAGGIDAWVQPCHWSGYFTFFLPLYITWRLIAVVQRMDPDYCERFMFRFTKPSR